MKKILPFVFSAIVAMNTSALIAAEHPGSNETKATSGSTTGPEEKQLSKDEVTQLANRYEEIQNMDKSNLSAAERKELRQEARDIKDTLKAQDGVILYLSGAAILVIILLIILL